MLIRGKQFSPRSPRGSLRKQGKPGGDLRAWRLDVVFSCRDFLYTTFFLLLSLAGLASGLYHTVARSLATIVLSKSASDHTCSSASESGLSRQLSLATRRLSFDCHTTRHEYCTGETAGGAASLSQAGKVQMAEEQDFSLLLSPFTGLVFTKGVSIVDMERKETSRKSKRRNTKTSLPKHHCVIVAGQRAGSCSTGCERCGRSS
jgi:hypothetical protein